jgi:hypothetical protein
LPVLEETDDHIEVQEKKRRVVVDSAAGAGHGPEAANISHSGSGELFGLVPPFLSVRGWSVTLSDLPRVEFGDVLVYLTTECNWSNERLKKYKSDSSYGLFAANHVHNVLISVALSGLPLSASGHINSAPCVADTGASVAPSTSGSVNSASYYYVKGQCVPEQSQSSQPYDMWILLQKTGSIQSASCTCIAG